MKFPQLSKKHKIIAAVVVAVILIGVAVMVYRKRKAKAAQISPVTPQEPAATPVKSVAAVRGDNFPLKKGSKGQRVEQLQQYLRKKHNATFPKYGIDGKLSEETLGYMKEFLKVSEVSKDLFNELKMSGYKTYQDRYADQSTKIPAMGAANSTPAPMLGSPLPLNGSQTA